MRTAGISKIVRDFALSDICVCLGLSQTSYYVLTSFGKGCRYTMVVLWGLVVPHIAHAQTQTVYGIRLNIIAHAQTTKRFTAKGSTSTSTYLACLNAKC